MSVTVKTDPNVPFRCEITARTHAAVSDVDSSLSGGDTGPTPHEIILGGLAACTAMKIVARVRKKKLSVTGVTVEIAEDKIDDPDDTGTAKQQIIRVRETVTIEGTVSDSELAELKKAGESCPMIAWAKAKKVIETTVTRAA